MKPNGTMAVVMGLALGFSPVLAQAQSVNVTRSILPDQPYTLIYPDAMVASGSAGEPLTINHPNAPLQCTLEVVRVEDTGWSAQDALASLNEADVTAAWNDSLPGFALGDSGTAAYQDATALVYEGTSTDSPMGIPLTLVHTETVAEGRGYALDCLFATEVAQQARPIVDFIIANFSTRADAGCCVGVQAAEPDSAPPAQ